MAHLQRGSLKQLAAVLQEFPELVNEGVAESQIYAGGVHRIVSLFGAYAITKRLGRVDAAALTTDLAGE